jgi:hypothetical protein
MVPDDDVTEAAASRDAVATRDERDERDWMAAVEGQRWWSTGQCCRRWLDGAGGSSDGYSGWMAIIYRSFLPKTGYPKKYVD